MRESSARGVFGGGSEDSLKNLMKRSNKRGFSLRGETRGESPSLGPPDRLLGKVGGAKKESESRLGGNEALRLKKLPGPNDKVVGKQGRGGKPSRTCERKGGVGEKAGG